MKNVYIINYDIAGINYNYSTFVSLILFVQKHLTYQTKCISTLKANIIIILCTYYWVENCSVSRPVLEPSTTGLGSWLDLNHDPYLYTGLGWCSVPTQWGWVHLMSVMHNGRIFADPGFILPTCYREARPIDCRPIPVV